jgi:hypothetical protein
VALIAGCASWITDLHLISTTSAPHCRQGTICPSFVDLVDERVIGGCIKQALPSH